MSFDFTRVDRNEIPVNVKEVRAFACIRNETLRLPFLLDYHRSIGVNRFFFIDNISDDGTPEYLATQPDCHVFSCAGRFFVENVEPPRWTNALRNTFGDGHWCLSLDADEMFVYPHSEVVPVSAFCDYIETGGATALVSLVLDMYGDNPILDAAYRPGQSFIEACPHFDPELGWAVDANGLCPPTLMFSKFRERSFWHGHIRKQRPPCITQVPLVKWRRGMGYLVAQHSITEGILSGMQGTILHFKFLSGFIDGVVQSITENKGVAEKGLQERMAYVETLSRNPDLNLRNENSVTYRDTSQLVELGWLKTEPAYEQYVAERFGVKPNTGEQGTKSNASARQEKVVRSRGKVAPRSGKLVLAPNKRKAVGEPRRSKADGLPRR